jgi:hypothetical protein
MAPRSGTLATGYDITLVRISLAMCVCASISQINTAHPRTVIEVKHLLRINSIGSMLPPFLPMRDRPASRCSTKPTGSTVSL